jgi:large subunit ribosomal protein L24
MTKNNVAIKKGDQVKVIAGNDKGAEGKVLDVVGSRVIVEGVNRVKKHTRAGQQGGANTGGIITTEAPIHISNVMLVAGDGAKKATTRVGFRREDITKSRPDGSTYAAQRSVRIARKTGKDI